MSQKDWSRPGELRTINNLLSELVGTYCVWAVCGEACLRESGITNILGFNLPLEADDCVTKGLVTPWRAEDYK